MKYVLRIAVVVWAMGLAWPALAQGIGTQAPDFTLVGRDGEVIRLSDFLGRPLLLNVWASWCPPCVEELPLIQGVADALGPEVLGVLLLNNNERFETALAFLEEHNLSLPAALDPTRARRKELEAAGVKLDTTLGVLRAYRVRGMPTSFFIDADGVIRAVKVGAFTRRELSQLLAEIGVEWRP